MNKYTPAVLAGIRNGGGHALFPWPDEIHGLGRRSLVAFAACGDCRTFTFVAFGDHALCLPCVRRRTKGIA